MRPSSIDRKASTSPVLPLPSMPGMRKPDRAASPLAAISTGRRPKRSASAAEIGVAIAMKTTAMHSMPRKSERGMCRVPTP